jgi:integrase
MARQPLYRLHTTSGQARTTVNGKRVSLGKYGSPESRARYDQILAEWEANHALGTGSAAVDITVSRLAILFMQHANTEYVRDGRPTGEANNFRLALKAMTTRFHGVRVLEFGPRKLKLLRDNLVEAGYSQNTINGHLRRLKFVFDWGVSEELFPVRIAQALRTVKGLRSGKTKAAPPRSKRPVPIADVDAIKPFVTTPVWGLVHFMLLTGCRPSEAVVLRWSEIDTSRPVWVFSPIHHKNAHRGRGRHILIGPKCQLMLNSMRELSRSDYVFDPQTGMDEYCRKHFRAGSQPRAVGEKYSIYSIATAVRNACDKAGVTRWSPCQLRKTRATLARKQAGLDTAQQLLGHSSRETTERHYAEVDLAQAEANALKFG